MTQVDESFGEFLYRLGSPALRELSYKGILVVNGFVHSRVAGYRTQVVQLQVQKFFRNLGQPIVGLEAFLFICNQVEQEVKPLTFIIPRKDFDESIGIGE